MAWCISIHNVNIDRIVVSNKVLLGKKGFKHFIGYEDDSEKKYAFVYNAAKNECIQKKFWRT